MCRRTKEEQEGDELEILERRNRELTAEEKMMKEKMEKARAAYLNLIKSGKISIASG